MSWFKSPLSYLQYEEQRFWYLFWTRLLLTICIIIGITFFYYNEKDIRLNDTIRQNSGINPIVIKCAAEPPYDKDGRQYCLDAQYQNKEYK